MLKNRATRKSHMRLRSFVFLLSIRYEELKARDDIGCLPQEDRYATTRLFENRCKSICHYTCSCCHTSSINNVLRHGKCQNCTTKHEDHYLSKNQLPVWYTQDGRPQFHLPDELIDLTYAEKMLIQRLSPFIPMIHLKNGVHGLCGHVCAFEQDVEEFVNRLPRHRRDVTMLKVLKTVAAEIGDDKNTRVQAFRVRRKNVFDALRWLKKYNAEYSDIEIDHTALDWMDDEEGTIEGLVVDEYQDTSTDDMSTDPMHEDNGPDPRTTAKNERSGGDNIKAVGFIDDYGKTTLEPEDQIINDKLQETIRRSDICDEITTEFPSVQSDPVSEFSDTRIFARAFPWLFPGGIGDVKDDPENPGEWGRRLLLYKDGRFARDKFFGFFAMNYIMRQRNASSGKFFIDKFHSDCPDTLEELQESIQRGESKFVNSLTYYNKRIKGSSAYWFQKRSEVYTWINYHVEQGNGAPMFFITLSCAEYAWPDLIQLLKERMALAGENPEQCYVGSPKMSRIVNEYSIVIQEYFQKRVEHWLDTVGKDVFGIKHHWVRYEFAPGRGQIHAHMLAISDDQTIYDMCHIELQRENGEDIRAQHLSEWARKKFGLTASVDEDFDDIDETTEPSSVQIRFMDIPDDKESIRIDGQRLLKQCQMHQCSAYCMRHPRGKG